MSEDALESRVREAEKAQAVHEATCAERYKGIALRLNIITALLICLIGAAAAGNPVIDALRRWTGGG